MLKIVSTLNTFSCLFVSILEKKERQKEKIKEPKPNMNVVATE